MWCYVVAIVFFLVARRELPKNKPVGPWQTKRISYRSRKNGISLPKGPITTRGADGYFQPPGKPCGKKAIPLPS